jgi:uracil-DNA glycosylase
VAETAVASTERRERLVEVYRQASVCEKCPLSETRNKVVFGAGNSDADLMFVGEAPGAEEDRQGLPFVGRAGGFLGQLLEGIGMSREDVFVANVLKCRPPGNRDPQPEEIDSCRPWLEQQVQLIEPRIIATLGNFATKLITANPTGITKVRGTAQAHTIGGRQLFVLPLFHPAAGLRTPRVADQLREDFALIPELLKRALPEPPPGIVQVEADAAPKPDQLGFFG